MWFSARVELWTVDFISKPCNRAAMNILVGRAADDGSAVIGLVADGDDFQGHVVLLEVVDVSRSGASGQDSIASWMLCHAGSSVGGNNST